MRILFISDVYFPRVNGVSTSIRTFRRELHALGHEVVLIAPHYSEGSPADGAGVIRIPSRAVPLDPEDRLMGRRALRVACARLARGQFDLVHIQTPFAAHYAGLHTARALGVPCIATYHTFFEEYLYHYVPWVPRALMRKAARTFSRSQGNQLDALVVPSRAMLSTLAAYGVTTPMTVLPTGIRLEELNGGDGAAFRAQHGIPAGRPVLVHIGRVAFEKNIGFLLRMLVHVRARHPNVLLVIAGEGPALPDLRKAVVALDLSANVLFVGYLDRATTLLDCYRAGNVFVFASRTETQGLVLLEAMALGVPVVALAEMGTRDILAAGKGALVAEHQEESFAAAVCRLLDTPGLQQRLAAEGREYAVEWSAGRQAARLAEFYAEVIQLHY